VATARISFVAAALGLFLVGAFAVAQATPHVQERITDWLSPWTVHKVACPGTAPTLRQECQSYQLVQSLYSIGHGGFGGTGFGPGVFTSAGGAQGVPGPNTRL